MGDEESDMLAESSGRQSSNKLFYPRDIFLDGTLLFGLA